MSNKNELLLLADRVEKANGPDRELDGKIKLAYAAALFAAGASKDDAVRILNGDLYADPLHYTSSLDAAMNLVPGGYPIETMSWWPSVPAGYEDQRCCHLTLLKLDRGGFAGLKRFKARAATPALALTAASLRARA